MSKRPSISMVFKDYTYAQKAYEDGFRGAIYDPEANQRLNQLIESRGGFAFAEQAMTTSFLAGSGEQRISLPFLAVEKAYPGCFPGAAQTIGDCVSQSTAKAIWTSFVCEILHGDNAQRSELPSLSSEAIKNGCISSEAIYWYRGYGGDGWICAEAAEVCLKECGLFLRKPYPELELDLTEYSGRTAHIYGSKSPPKSITEIGQAHLVETTTVCRSFESCRDMLANGYCISSCGSEAFESVRDKYGIANRSRKSWAHAIAVIGCDDRPSTVSREGSGLLLFCNSWGKDWISGNRVIDGMNYEIPQGSFWARWEDVSNRYYIAMSSSKGWPAKQMPDWGLEGIV